VQTYQKRALPMLKYIVGLAQETNRILHVRLVKGAYWDAEIKRGQERGLPGYPLYTRKPNTDVSYLACARYAFEQGKDVLYPQFATHNAHTVAAVASMAKKVGFEFEFPGSICFIGASIFLDAVAPAAQSTEHCRNTIQFNLSFPAFLAVKGLADYQNIMNCRAF